jgi:tRNA (cytidine56-2'-O)-methyltransferase
VVVAERDNRVVEGVRDVTRRFGGPFEVESGVAWRPLLKDAGATKVHLTMYGEPFQDVLPRIDPARPLLVVVGAEKVPREVYELADHNASVGSQPHSEVAALAIFLFALQGRNAFAKRFEGEIEVEPSARGKIVRAKGARGGPPPDRADPDDG